MRCGYLVISPALQADSPWFKPQWSHVHVQVLLNSYSFLFSTHRSSVAAKQFKSKQSCSSSSNDVAFLLDLDEIINWFSQIFASHAELACQGIHHSYVFVIAMVGRSTQSRLLWRGDSEITRKGCPCEVALHWDKDQTYQLDSLSHCDSAQSRLRISHDWPFLQCLQ